MDIRKSQLKKSLAMSWQWFTKSGVMLPEDGSWGLGERVMLTAGNEAMNHIITSFPAWTPHKDYYIIEQRRADCNMQAAFLFLLMHKLDILSAPCKKTAENLLDFLYYRSGLLNRAENSPVSGLWDWSHIKRSHVIYFDDDSWMLFLAWKIAKKYPALDRKYGMKKFALLLAERLLSGAIRYFKGEADPDKEKEENSFYWQGKILLPHWGSLVCMALAETYRETGDEKYLSFIEMYEKYLVENADTFTSSEFGYALIGSTCAYTATGSKASLECAELFADKILKIMDPETGCIPSEHYEAPSGKSLADTIYTLNWAVLGLQNMAQINNKYDEAYKKLLSLLLKIQDRSRASFLYGCWRGMYDMESGKWGGGDRFEGGANSIYTGWTNAPIAWACAFELLNSSLSKI